MNGFSINCLHTYTLWRVHYWFCWSTGFYWFVFIIVCVFSCFHCSISLFVGTCFIADLWDHLQCDCPCCCASCNCTHQLCHFTHRWCLLSWYPLPSATCIATDREILIDYVSGWMDFQVPDLHSASPRWKEAEAFPRGQLSGWEVPDPATEQQCFTVAMLCPKHKFFHVFSIDCFAFPKWDQWMRKQSSVWSSLVVTLSSGVLKKTVFWNIALQNCMRFSGGNGSTKFETCQFCSCRHIFRPFAPGRERNARKSAQMIHGMFTIRQSHDRHSRSCVVFAGSFQGAVFSC